MMKLTIKPLRVLVQVPTQTTMMLSSLPTLPGAPTLLTTGNANTGTKTNTTVNYTTACNKCNNQTQQMKWLGTNEGKKIFYKWMQQRQQSDITNKQMENRKCSKLHHRRALQINAANKWWKLTQEANS